MSPFTLGTMRALESPQQMAAVLEAAIEAARKRLGLDQPFLVQFWHWLVAVLHGDLGTSFTSGKPVTELIAERLPITLSLTAGAVLVGLLISIPLGVFAAMAVFTPYVAGFVE